MLHSLDQLVTFKDVPTLKPLMTDQKLKRSVRLLCVFGYNGSEVIYATRDDRVYGFGHNLSGRLGVGTNEEHLSSPRLIDALSGQQLADIVCGFAFCIGFTAGGQSYGWGENQFGQLGIGSIGDSNHPQLVARLANERVTAVACGNSHTLALVSGGQVFGFGRNDLGQLGDGSSQNRTAAVPVLIPSDATVVSISCGKNHSLAVTDTGRVFVWGFNKFGQLGRHRKLDLERCHQTCWIRPEPLLDMDGVVVEKALCGPYNTLLLSTEGHMYAFGENIFGQIGNGSRNPQFTPIHICRDVRFKDIVTDCGYRMAIALAVNDQYYVWGYPAHNIQSQTNFVSTPRPVSETAVTHTSFDIYTIYSKHICTHKTVVFSGAVNDSPTRLATTDGNQMNAISNDEELLPLIEFSKHLSHSFNNKKDHDFVINVNGRAIYCHKFILQLRNKQFWRKCEDMLKKSPTSDQICINRYFSYDAFHAFIRFLYGLWPDIDDRNSREVLQLAKLFDEPELKEMCDNMGGTGDGHPEPTIDNVCAFYETAINDNLSDLEKSCVKFAINNVVDVLKSDAFHAMPKHISKRLLKCIYE